MGRSVANHLDPDVLLSVTSGLAVIKTEPVNGVPIEPEAVFQSLENARNTGELSKQVTTSAIPYQASSSHPGYLERIDKNGNVTTGQFKQGEFIALKE